MIWTLLGACFVFIGGIFIGEAAIKKSTKMFYWGMGCAIFGLFPLFFGR